MYMCVPCYCDACLKSSMLHVGVKTLHNTVIFAVDNLGNKFIVK